MSIRSEMASITSGEILTRQHRTIPQWPIRIFRVARLTISVGMFLDSGRSPTSSKEQNRRKTNRYK
jgi:hypothetical protein